MDSESFRSALSELGIEADESAAPLCKKYVGLLLEWNRKVNLISRKDESNIWVSHILHSAAILSKIRFPESSKVVDVGTGGGLPGIVIKIMRPDLEVLLLDSVSKKIAAVSEMIPSLGLEEIKAKTGRAEAIAHDKNYAKQYDFVVARSVAPLKDLLKWTYPLLKNRTDKFSAKIFSDEAPHEISSPALISFKGGDLSDELRAIRKENRILHTQVLELSLEKISGGILEEKKLVVVML